MSEDNDADLEIDETLSQNLSKQQTVPKAPLDKPFEEPVPGTSAYVNHMPPKKRIFRFY